MLITRAMRQDEDDPDDPVLGQFLDFLACDMTIHRQHQHIRAVEKDLLSHIRSLVSNVEVDLDAWLGEEVVRFKPCHSKGNLQRTGTMDTHSVWGNNNQQEALW